MSAGILALCQKADKDRMTRALSGDEPLPGKKKSNKNTIYYDEKGNKAYLSDLAYSYQIGHNNFAKLYKKHGGDWKLIKAAFKISGHAKRKKGNS